VCVYISPFALCCVCFVLSDFWVVFAIVRSCFSWDSSYDIMLMMWLCVGLQVCGVLFARMTMRDATV
jgi:hypothetical protein